jgi:acyl carrier protein
MSRDDIIEINLSIITSRITFSYEGIDEETEFKDLGFDSLDTLEVALLIEEEFDLNVPINNLKNMRRISDLVDYIHSELDEN